MSDETTIRVPTCDLPDAAALAIFRNHIPKSGLSPKTLWRLKSVAANHVSSDWGKMHRELSILLDLADAGNGAIANQASLHRSFRKWLDEEGINWCRKDSDTSIWHLRVALMSCLSLKRPQKMKDGTICAPRGAPAKYPELQVIIDKLNEDWPGQS